jgi:NAD(P)-dependent dehydrogenase (short-subunit alcohol dehydrogenase family)/pimeloyl-ACP methyl ester carboxylesterase
VRVTATDGVELAVYVHGEPDAPTVVLVHGFPDNHTVWDAVVPELSRRYHVVTYDVRGHGESGAPRGRAAYRFEQLEADLASVIDAVSPDRPVHLVGHDWGTIQSWYSITHDRLRGRVLSATLTGGADIDTVAAWMRSAQRRPSRLPAALLQLVRSAYIGFFQLPVLPTLAIRVGAARPVLARIRAREGLPADWPNRHDLLQGVSLYRANFVRSMVRPRPLPAHVPVQVVIGTKDPYASEMAQLAAVGDAPESFTRRITAGHWLPRTHAPALAGCISDLVERVETGTVSRALARASAGSKDHFAHRLAVVTGAGSGIGRATALALADRGADLVLTDIDLAGVTRTAELAALLGVHAEAYSADVGDPAAMEQLAEQVLGKHGVPDLVINNAGIGMAGPFVSTSHRDWERVLDVNLWGVIHGCQAFVPAMVARAEGGHIVNIASAAAYLPSKSYPAYATTKAAVLQLSQCLRAELHEAGIAVTAICPGIVNSNISATTTWVGLSEEQEKARQKKAVRLYGRRNFTPEKTALHILRAIERNAAIAPITTEAKGGLLLSRMTPGLLRAAARADVLAG